MKNNTDSIYLTGSNGFVGSYLSNYLISNYDIKYHVKGNPILISQNIVIHLAGKAHDLKNVLDPTEYYINNTDFTKEVFDAFLISEAKIFIFTSSVKAVADSCSDVLTEETICKPTSHYGRSKLMAEQYILSKKIPNNKFVFILRPAMIHGPGNKGNFNLLFHLLTKGLPWPLGKFYNKRSFCSIDNFCFIIKELITSNCLISGIYNISDDQPVSTNDVIKFFSKSLKKNINILAVPKIFIKIFVFISSYFHKDINLNNLEKLTSSFVVSNRKIKNLINKPLPLSAEQGLTLTFNSFKTKIKQ